MHVRKSGRPQAISFVKRPILFFCPHILGTHCNMHA